MRRLTGKDYRAALDFLRFAGDLQEADAFPEPVLERLRRLVPCNSVSYGDYAGDCARRRSIRAAPADVLPIPQPVARAAAALRHEHPLRPRRKTLGRALRICDVMTRSEFRSTPLYEAVARPLGIEYTIEMWIADGDRIIGGFGFDASRREFSERDKLVLETLAPHLVQLHRAAHARVTRARETSAAGVLTRRELEVLRLSADGLTTKSIGAALRISPGTVRKHVDNVFSKLGVRTRAAAVAAVFGEPK